VAANGERHYTGAGKGRPVLTLTLAPDDETIAVTQEWAGAFREWWKWVPGLNCTRGRSEVLTACLHWRDRRKRRRLLRTGCGRATRKREHTLKRTNRPRASAASDSATIGRTSAAVLDRLATSPAGSGWSREGRYA